MAKALAAAWVATLALAGGAQAAWTTYGHDALRSGIDPDSTSPLTAVQTWQSTVDGKVYAEPLVLGSQVYVATENDTVYALDAATGAVVWHKSIGTPAPSGVQACGNIVPTIGITSTPVIDPATNVLYAVGETWDGSQVHHMLDAFNLADNGASLPGFPVDVDPPVPNPDTQLQRAALALDEGRVIIGYGGNDGDCGTYWGWLVGAPESGSGAQLRFQADPGANGGSIWGGGDGPTVDGSGDVFVATGNGSSSQFDYSESVVRLNSSLGLLDYWAPTNWKTLDQTDTDLGSTEPLLLPGGLLFQGGKDGYGRLLEAGALGHIADAVYSLHICNANIDGAPVYADGTIYVPCLGGLRAVTLNTSGATPTLSPKTGFSAPSGAVGTPIVAGGLVWVASYTNGTLYGLDPATGKTNATFNLGSVEHFATPSAGGGRLFAPDGTHVTGFQIANAPTATTTTLGGTPNPAGVGATVTFTAAVAPAPDGGTVAFTDGGTPIAGCAATALSGAGTATCSTSYGAAGPHSVVATYSGDANFAASASAPLTEVVNATAPLRLSTAALRPHRFRARKGATLFLTSSAPATVTASVTFWVRGHKVRSRCQSSAKHGPRCRVRRTVKLKFTAVAGANRFRFVPRKLEPGRHTVRITARDTAGQVSNTVKLRFTIIRRRRS